MQRTIEILLVIGVLVNLIKGSELVLRPHQEKWLQNKFETLVLWFEYARPIDWLAKREGTVYRTLFVLLVTLFLIGTLVLIINPKNGSWWELILITFIAIVWGLEQAMKTIKDDSRFARWLFQNLPIRQRLGRHIAISILVITSLVLFWIMFAGQSNNEDSFSLLITLVKGICVAVIFLFTVLGLPSLVIVTFSLFFLLAELLLKFIRGISWRIVEYNKGVFAAIVLLITIALGVAEIYLKSQPI